MSFRASSSSSSSSSSSTDYSAWIPCPPLTVADRQLLRQIEEKKLPPITNENLRKAVTDGLNAQFLNLLKESGDRDDFDERQAKLQVSWRLHPDSATTVTNYLTYEDDND
jgi:hypothetical protein